MAGSQSRVHQSRREWEMCASEHGVLGICDICLLEQNPQIQAKSPGATSVRSSPETLYQSLLVRGNPRTRDWGSRDRACAGLP